MLYHAHTTDEILAELRSSEKGLHQIYAEGRLAQYGRNTIRLTRQSLWHTLFAPFMSMFVLVLLIALGFSILVEHLATSLVLAGTMLTYLVMRYIQSYSLERTLRRTEHHTIAPVMVVRDGIQIQLDSALVVPGDIVVLATGDQVPADGRILHTQSLYINQIHLTGNSSPMIKHAKTLHSATPLEEQYNMVFRGSFVVSGGGKYVVTATGNATHYGQVNSAAIKAAASSQLQQKIDKLLDYIASAGLIVALFVAIVGYFQGLDISEGVEYFVAVLIAAVPEGLPVAISIIIAIGLQRMTRDSVLLTSIRSIESTSSATVLASDKTGMLTRNKLSVKEIWQPGRSSKKLQDSCAHALVHEGEDEHDAALKSYIRQEGLTLMQHKPAVHFAFSKDTGMSGNLWHHGNSYVLYLKGAPEKILNHTDLTQQEYDIAHKELQHLASRGYHVLALAHGETKTPVTKLTSLPKRHKLYFDGFVAMQDHLRPDVKVSIEKAASAGIRTCLVTGDHVETSYRLGQTLGIVSSRSQIFDSRKLAVISDVELARIAKDIVIFARVAPEHKHRILSALKRHHVVMMTGDSIDDVPVLTHAHVGITTQHSSQIARESSDLVLLDDKFSTVLEAIRHSRTILGNMRRMVFFVLVMTIGELGIVIGSLALGLPVALSPIQLLWINLVVAAATVIPLGIEPHSRNIMTRKPVPRNAPILPVYLTIRALVLASAVALVGITIFAYTYRDYGIEYARSLVFYTLVIMQLTAAIIARSDHTSTLVRFRTWSPFIYLGIICIVVLQVIIFTTPVGQLLAITYVTAEDLLACALLAIIVPLVIGELFKFYSRHAVRRKGRSYI